ncbi:MAG: type II secretion system protein GspJ [Tepidisphaeraceae bacterium]|jgi:prepilin-type N-terminal cleavage/methylation domain-containing protein
MTQSRRKSSRTPRGFTLLELVVALGMVAVLAVSLYTSIHIAFGATASAESALEPPRTAEIALDFIQNDFQNAMAPNATGTTYGTVAVSTAQSSTNLTITTSTGAANQTVLAGNFEALQEQDDRGHEADDVVFFTTASGPLHTDANGEIKQVEYAVQRASDGQYELIRRVGRNLLSEQMIQPDEEVLCRGVDSFTIQYSTGSEWLDTWDSTQEDNTLPAAVQITLVLARPSGTGTQTLSFTRVIPLSLSTAALDPNVNTAVSMQ